MLRAGFVLYGMCGKGFVVDEVSGPRLSNPSHFAEPRAAFFPEIARISRAAVSFGWSLKEVIDRGCRILW